MPNRLGEGTDEKSKKAINDPAFRLLVTVGFCGAYTTFSSYAFETLRLVEQGQLLSAMGNLVTNNLLSLIGVLAGMVLARSI